MTGPMMDCGCASNADMLMPDGSSIPACAIHDCTLVAAAPNLDGRTARCGCGKIVPSSLGLAFFQYRGPGSRDATEKCVCGYYQSAHTASPLHRRIRDGACHGQFQAHGPHPLDLWYCGCRGHS